MEGLSCFVSTRSHTEDKLNVADKLLCNICDLEPLRDPVVTSCGHLYCWPCLDKWLQNQAQKHCRACATPLIDDANFVKIYGTDSQILDEQSDQTVFECRICLEPPPPTNAVATSCGHVFCWPCLYQWLQTHHQAKRPCPVCRNVLMRYVNVLPLYGSHEMNSGNHGPSNVCRAAEAASGEFFIPPRPNPPEDALALSSRMYSTSDDELETGNENVDQSSDDPNDDMSTSDEESDDDTEPVITAWSLLGLRWEMVQGRVLRRALRREELQLMRRLVARGDDDQSAVGHAEDQQRASGEERHTGRG